MSRLSRADVLKLLGGLFAVSALPLPAIGSPATVFRFDKVPEPGSLVIAAFARDSIPAGEAVPAGWTMLVTSFEHKGVAAFTRADQRGRVPFPRRGVLVAYELVDVPSREPGWMVRQSKDGQGR